MNGKDRCILRQALLKKTVLTWHGTLKKTLRWVINTSQASHDENGLRAYYENYGNLQAAEKEGLWDVFFIPQVFSITSLSIN